MSKWKPDYNYIGYGINFDVEKYSKDKKVIADTIGLTLIDKMQSAFIWKGLPDTIPQKWLETQLIINGYTCITKVNDKLYALWGGLGGEPDVYYQPTICSVASPALNYSKNLKIDTECTIISNDTMRTGIIPLIGKYSGLLAENTITMRLATILARNTMIASAGDEKTIESFTEYFNQLEDGKIGAIAENPFFDNDLKVQPSASTGNTKITDLIELEQYLKASLYNELGLQANYNMKRESINSNESQLNDDAIQPFIDNMLKERQEGAEKVNALYGINISVDFATAWKNNELEREIELKNIESEVHTENARSERSSDAENSISQSGDNTEDKNEI